MQKFKGFILLSIYDLRLSWESDAKAVDVSKSMCTYYAFKKKKKKTYELVIFWSGVLVLGLSILCSMEVCGPIVGHF